MAHKKGNSLRCHLTFYPAAAKGFTQVEEILDNHRLRILQRIYIGIIYKNETKFCQVITNGEWTVMADG